MFKFVILTPSTIREGITSAVRLNNITNKFLVRDITLVCFKVFNSHLITYNASFTTKIAQFLSDLTMYFLRDWYNKVKCILWNVPPLLGYYNPGINQHHINNQILSNHLPNQQTNHIPNQQPNHIPSQQPINGQHQQHING